MKKKISFTFSENTTEYKILLRKRKFPWWIFLLLLPLLLLIRCNKDVKFKTVDASNGSSLSKSFVKFSYFERNIFSQNKIIELTDSTDKNGEVIFKNLSYSVFSWIFQRSDLSNCFASNECFASDSLKEKFVNLHYSPETLLKLAPRSFDLEVKVIDKDDNQPLPSATVKANSESQNWTETTNAAGNSTLKQTNFCGKIKIVGSCYGYSNDSVEISVKFAATNKPILRLKPIKKMVAFLVKDLKTKQPIPDVSATLNVENQTLNIRTNTNGVGKGAFENVHILKQMLIKVSHPSYYDTISQKYQVDAFTKMSEEQRTLFMRPKTGTLVFKNVDAETNSPLEGVDNQIVINGTQSRQISNSNGIFTVAEIPQNATISIIASKTGYSQNNFTVRNKTFSELNGNESARIIPLKKNLPPSTDNKPRENCRVFVTGLIVSDEFIESNISEAYVADRFSEYVGQGEYPDNEETFPNSVKFTFDGIAIDKGTRIIIYSEKNFQGRVLLDKKGPAIVNNVKWKDDSRYSSANTKNYKEPLQSNFPQSVREWSKEDMNPWSKGSVKVICEQ